MKTILANFFRKEGLSMRLIFAMYIITVIHHIQGGIIYHSQARIDIAIFFTIAVAATYLLYRFGKQNKWVKYAYWFVAAVLWVAVLGLIEGGYNHVFKVGMWLGGADPAYLASFYDAAEYEPPKDVFFEITGILTIVPALVMIGGLFNKDASKKKSR